MHKHKHIQSSLSEQDVSFEIPLRPQSLDSFIGQKKVVERLNVMVGAAQKRKDILSHCLFSGPPGLGKTTLCYILAKLIGTNLVVTSAPVIEKPADLAGILTNLSVGDIFFIDEIHRLNKAVEEYLYSAMEDFSLDLLIDSGPNARSVQVKLHPFTLAGATTRSGLLSSPLRSRFALQFRLDFYSPEELMAILLRSANILNLKIEKKGALEIAGRSRGTPRIANNLLKWVRDVTQMEELEVIDMPIAKKALKMLCIDEKGLDEMDKRILHTIYRHHQGGPVGIQTLSVSVGEEVATIAEVYEPYLIMQGFLKRTLRGRELTELAYEHLGYQKPKKMNGVKS